MFCSKCGQENDNSAKFCSSCGNVLGSDVEKSAEQKAEEIKQKSKESASTLFYLIKPLLKAKVLVPLMLIILGSIFYPNMKSAYEDWQYQREKLAKEKRETFTDSQTGLMWQDDFYTYKRERDWDGAVSYCENTEYAGYSDWYLPTKSQLKDLYSKKSYLNSVVSDYYWSSSEYVLDTSKACYVVFYNGHTYWLNKSYKNSFRCVRGRQ